MFEKLKALNSRVHDLTMRTKMTEEKAKENRGQQQRREEKKGEPPARR
jgi:hypothetical protein